MANQTAANQQPAGDAAAEAFPINTGFSWLTMEVPPIAKAVPGPKGMRLRDVENENTRPVPDHWPFVNDHPRGAVPAKLPQIPAGYTIFEKADVWSENCIDLYEDAIYDRWSSATSIPWETIAPLPEVKEAAIDQLCTELSEQAYLDVQILSKWLEHISYGFKEVKNFLATYIYDRGRHTEAFRKRALANGGGLGIEGTGIYHRAILGSLRYPDLVMALFIRSIWTKAVCKAVAGSAHLDVDRRLFSLTAQDIGRHIAYQMGMLKFALAKDPTKDSYFNFALTRHELQFVAETNFAASFNEALILTLAENATEGRERLNDVRRAAVKAYVTELEAAGLTGRAEKMHPSLKNYAPEPATA